MFSTSHYLNLTLPQHSFNLILPDSCLQLHGQHLANAASRAFSFTLPTSQSALKSTSPRINLLAGRRPAWLRAGSVPSLLRFFTGLQCQIILGRKVGATGCDFPFIFALCVDDIFFCMLSSNPAHVAGHWVRQVYRCGQIASCPGGLPAQCNNGLIGVLCGECPEGWWLQ